MSTRGVGRITARLIAALVIVSASCTHQPDRGAGVPNTTLEPEPNVVVDRAEMVILVSATTILCRQVRDHGFSGGVDEAVTASGQGAEARRPDIARDALLHCQDRVTLERMQPFMDIPVSVRPPPVPTTTDSACDRFASWLRRWTETRSDSAEVVADVADATCEALGQTEP